MTKYVDWYRSTGRENFKFAKTIEEALSMEPMNLPELSSMRKKLMDSFPYDLWAWFPDFLLMGEKKELCPEADRKKLPKIWCLALCIKG